MLMMTAYGQRNRGKERNEDIDEDHEGIILV